MTPETKAAIIQSHRDIADAWEADSTPSFPDFENAVAIIVDDPETVWTDDALVLDWTISTYGKLYKELREITKDIASTRDLNFTTSFIPEDTIRTTFIVKPLEQEGKDKDDK